MYLYIYIYIYIYTRVHLIIMADSVKFQPVPAVLYERRFFRSSLTLPNRCALSSVLFFYPHFRQMLTSALCQMVAAVTSASILQEATNVNVQT